MIDNKNAELLEYVIKNISSTSQSDAIGLVLGKMVDTFRLDAAFVYLKDYEKGSGYYLIASAAGTQQDRPEAKHVQLPDQIDVTLDVIEDSEKFRTYLQQTLKPLFDAAQIRVMPVLDSERVVGFVCMLAVDRKLSTLDNNTLRVTAILVADKAKEIYLKQRQHRSRASLERAIDYASIDIYVTDYYTNEILYVNKSMAAPYGGPENMLGRTCYLALYTDKTEECDYCPKHKLIDENGKPPKLYSWDYQRALDG